MRSYGKLEKLVDILYNGGYELSFNYSQNKGQLVVDILDGFTEEVVGGVVLNELNEKDLTPFEKNNK